MFNFAPTDRAELIRTLGVCKYQNSAKTTVSQALEAPEDKKWVESYYNPQPERMDDSQGHSEGEGEDERFDELAKSSALGEEHIAGKVPFSDAVQGMGNDRTFVVMGNNIIVYKAHPDIPNSLEYLATLPVVSKYIPPGYVPQKPALFQSEHSLLMLNPAEAAIYRMDLEKGTVVEQYKTGGKITQVTPVTKNAQLLDDKDFLGISDRGFYRFDTRQHNAASK